MLVEALSLLLLGASPVTAPAPDRVRPEPLTVQDIARATRTRIVPTQETFPGLSTSFPPAWYSPTLDRIKARRELVRILLHRSCRNARAQAPAVFILTHETGHSTGIYSESGANVYAASHWPKIARRLRFNPERLRPHIPALGSFRWVWSTRMEEC
jgi:hypothetical protein